MSQNQRGINKETDLVQIVRPRNPRTEKDQSKIYIESCFGSTICSKNSVATQSLETS